MSVSVLILTLDEEANLPRCLESVAWSDDIVVLDSGSTDRTVDIARAAGARVFVRQFDDWASHQNWAVENISFKHPWVYYSDADEVVTKDLKAELVEIAGRATGSEVAYRVRFRNMFMSRWIKHASLYPTWVMRFFRPDKVRWRRLVNPTVEVDGPMGYLASHFEHYSFSKGLNAWFDKHNRYSWHEAIEARRRLESGRVSWKKLFERDHAERRRALKELSFALPFRPSCRFVYMYFIRGGFLDGYPGYTYCRLLAIYEYLIVLKMRELTIRERGMSL